MFAQVPRLPGWPPRVAVVLALFMLAALLPAAGGAPRGCVTEPAAVPTSTGQGLAGFHAHAQLCALCLGCQQCQPLPAAVAQPSAPEAPPPAFFGGPPLTEVPPDPAFRPPRA